MRSIDGGIGENTIPGECTLRIGVRYRTESLAQEIKENLKEATASQTVPDTWADLDLTHLIPAMDLKEGGKGLIVKLQEAAAFYSMSPIKGIQVGGLSDAGLAASLGIPTLCGMGVIGSGAIRMKKKPWSVPSLNDRSLQLRCFIFIRKPLRLLTEGFFSEFDAKMSLTFHTLWDVRILFQR